MRIGGQQQLNLGPPVAQVGQNSRKTHKMGNYLVRFVLFCGKLARSPAGINVYSQSLEDRQNEY